MARSSKDLTILQMALVGYQLEKNRIEAQMRELRARLKGMRGSAAGTTERKPQVKRVLSEDARNRIAAAQKKRWAEHRKLVDGSAKSGD